MIGKQKLRSEPTDIDEIEEEPLTVDQRLDRIKQNSWPVRHLPTDSDIDEGFRKPGVPNDPDDIDNDVDEDIPVMLESKEGSITGGDDRLMLSSFPNTLLKNNIL